MKLQIPILPGDIFLLDARFLAIADRHGTDFKTEYPDAVAHFYVLVDLGSEKVFSVQACAKNVARALAVCSADLGLAGVVSWFRSKTQFQDASWARMDHLITVCTATEGEAVEARVHAICKSAVPEQMAFLFPRMQFGMVSFNETEKEPPQDPETL